MENMVYVKEWFLKKIEHEKNVRIFSFKAEVLKETEKAVYVKFAESHSYRTQSGKVESWVPKSCLHGAEEAASFEANLKAAAEKYGAVVE